MVTPRNLMTVVTAAASLFLMPATNFSDTLSNPIFASPALASFPKPVEATHFSYVPPRRGMPRRTQGTGSRGCTSSQPVALELLVPNDHTAQTASGHPTFFWYVSEMPAEPVEVALVESGVAQPVFVQQVQLKNAGINQLKMPANLPELVPGKEYRWSVTLICNANRRSNDTFAQGWIKRVPPSADLEQQLSAAKTAHERASVYAKAGVWYDALNALSADASIRKEFLSLLDQVGLSEVAIQEQQRTAR